MADLFSVLMTLTLVCGCLSVDLKYSVKEESDLPVVLGDIADGSDIESKTTVEERKNLNFNFVNLGSTYINLFKLDDTTGILSVVSRIDREALCGSQPSCVLELVIGASSGNFFSSIDVEVTIIDVNDQAPTFSKKTKDLQIAENIPVESTFSITSATDSDASNSSNSLITYTLTPDTGTFSLKLETNAQGGKDLSLVIKQELDYESQTNYQMFVLAKDSGKPQNTGTLTVNIFVEDFNDNKPVFTSDHYNTTVKEDIKMNTSIMKVTASDKDSGDNGKITYEFSIPNSMFSINAVSGEIRVVQQLTVSKSQAPVQLYVRARDSGVQQKTSVTTVDVHVIDINNHHPEININVLPNSNHARAKIFENSVAGTVVAYVAVVDKDFNDNAKVTCSIKNPKFSLQKIAADKENEYKVVTNVELDREKDIEHVVTVFCEDSGSPRLNKTESFLVEVQDMNDNDPVFTKNVYYFNITENNNQGVMVAKVVASDKDQGVNAQVMYYVEKDFADMFYVEPTSGKVKANIRFDRELLDEVIFSVLAIDQGTPSHTSNATVVLKILDANDEYPTFSASVFNFSILENQDGDTPVGNVSAIDHDIGDNGRVLFSLPSQYRVTLPFVVFPNGEIKSNRPLDRELKSKYEFTVTATDMGVPARSSHAKILIKVLDQNDNYPQIVSPVQNNESVTLSHRTQPGNQVTRIEAYDLDEGQNSALLYSMTSDDNVGLFYIEETTGKIYLAREINTDDIKTYTMFIIVSDKGAVPKQSGTQLKLKIEYVQEVEKAAAAIGQNVLIAITIACVTIVLSLAIIVTIFLIRRVDRQKRNGGLPNNEDKSLESYHPQSKKPCLTVGREEGRQPVSDTVNKGSPVMDPINNGEIIKKEVSFSLDDHREHRDSGVFMIANDLPNQQSTPRNYNQSHSLYPGLPNNDVELSDSSPDELNRMASIRLHQKYLHTYNKPLVYHPDENRQILLMKKSMEDTRSDGSGEVTTTDSGQGSSHEDMMNQTSIMI